MGEESPDGADPAVFAPAEEESCVPADAKSPLGDVQGQRSDLISVTFSFLRLVGSFSGHI